MHLPLLEDIIIILGFSVVVVFIFNRMKVPSVLGFLITGLIIGPYGLSLVKQMEKVEIFSEIGVILLLFVIGMELSLKQLISIRKTVFIGGFLQVGLAILVASLVFKFLDFSWNKSVFLGLLFSLSSTAIVLKILHDRNEISAPHGRNALGILIFQDIIVIPMMLITPILAGTTENVTQSVIYLLIKSGLVVLFTYISAKYLVPRLLFLIAKTKSKELFLLTTISICFAVAYLTSEAGLSLAFGAFLAGLIISESDYSHHATSLILPFRELFTSFFFISVGMLLDINFFIHNMGVILVLVLIVFFVKSFLAGTAVFILHNNFRTAFLTGLSLFQIGEFAFILSRVGIENNLISELINQYFLSVSIITMFFTPFVILFSETLYDKANKGVAIWSKRKLKYIEEQIHHKLENHLVIIGYGINGTNLSRAAKYGNIPYVIIELNADTVRKEKAKGEPIFYGDATHDYMLNSLNLNKAKVVVIAISDPFATKRIVTNIRNNSQSIHIIVRTRYVKEINELLTLGADEVIPEEFETSIEIFSRVLHNYLIPVDNVQELIDAIRSDNYEVFRHQKKTPKTIRPTNLPELKVTCIRIESDSGQITGKSIGEANIRKKYGVNILAISRNGNLIYHVSPEEKILQDDLVYLSGDQVHIDQFYHQVK